MEARRGAVVRWGVSGWVQGGCGLEREVCGSMLDGDGEEKEERGSERG